MFYNDSLGNETISKEYKEFTFNHIGLEFDVETAEKLIKSGKWIFNEQIISSIQKYMKIYIPKYISGFMDLLSDTQVGELYIGVDDFGIINGIPYQGDLPIDDIIEYFNIIIDKYIMHDNKAFIKKNIDIEIIKISYNNQELPHHIPYLERYYKYMEEYNKAHQFYLEQNKIWYANFSQYTQKLVDLFNQPSSRKEIYDYIKNLAPTSAVLTDMDNGYQLPVKTHEEINEVKDDPLNAYFWICAWKDEKIDLLKQIKPQPKYRYEMPPFLNPLNILTKVSPMIPWWMQNNYKMNLYIIKITFKKLDDTNIYYLDTFNKINRCYRTLTLNKPCCMPFYDSITYDMDN